MDSSAEDSSSEDAVAVSLKKKDGKQILVIKMEVEKIWYHEGHATGKIACQGCNDRPKRYYRIELTNGDDAFMCRNCISDEVECSEDSWESDDNYWISSAIKPRKK